LEVTVREARAHDELGKYLDAQLPRDLERFLDLRERDALVVFDEPALGNGLDAHEQPFKADLAPHRDHVVFEPKEAVDPAITEVALAAARRLQGLRQRRHAPTMDEGLIIDEEHEVFADLAHLLGDLLDVAHVVATVHDLPE